MSEAAARREFEVQRLPLVLARNELEPLAIALFAKYPARLVCDNFLEAKSALEGGRLAAFLPDFLMSEATKEFVRVRVSQIGSKPFQFYLAWNPRLLRLNPHAVRRKDLLVEILSKRMGKWKNLAFAEKRLVNARKKFASDQIAKQNVDMNTDWNRLKELASAEIETTLAELPGPLREQARKLPVTFEKAPNKYLQDDGIEADTLGLFTGCEFADSGSGVLPAQIILFLENLWDVAEGDEEVFCDEVHTTFLHELGHFFGLDEDDLTARGLD